ncbi:hypothetical protein UY3_17046 [Chelonia mydas]|uniref:Uncharacterized protein n=1 Tax=Chelonia mydas TaxID=8469 RepID=M7B1C6_CHEMY|nr:hypothetical protein UY3_17046 [Chelonia mydas]
MSLGTYSLGQRAYLLPELSTFETPTIGSSMGFCVRDLGVRVRFLSLWKEQKSQIEVQERTPGVASSVAEPTSVALLDPLGLSPRTRRNPGSPLCDVFCGIRHFRSPIRCAPAFGTYCPDASDSGTVLGSDLGIALDSVFTPVSHSGTIVDINPDVGTGPSTSLGSCECTDAAPSHHTDDGTNVYLAVHCPGTVAVTATTNATRESGDPSGVDGRELPLPVNASSSLSPDEALVGTAIAPCVRGQQSTSAVAA